MDCKHLTRGSVLYLPVFAPGGLVATGDIHAYQGDGEIVGGLEVAGEVDLKLEVIKGIAEPWPILETNDRWYAIV
ncbi:acetamidase/formamidase family protein, partial [Eggerthella lenta]|uniref:acetamidase/formamidase family protein n=2 Tax=Bacillati TaxID=1783272 RepID=UPI001D07406F|nr:acetamidase/formamidase family protein [Eggerthella lenta]